MEVEAQQYGGLLLRTGAGAGAGTGRGRPPRHLLYGHPRHQPPQGGDDEYFPCPFCYTEVEVPILCSHLQQEHCFDTRNAVCPICADSLGNGTAAHFRIQHSLLLKRRKSSSKPGPASDKEADGDEDSYSEEASSSSYSLGRQAPDPTPDPLLSHFLCIVAPIELVPGETEEEADVSPIPDDQRTEQSVSDDASKQQQDIEERLQRVEFVKQMLMTTIS